MRLKELFDESKEKWGIPSQLLMLVEELNELSVATLHLMRKGRDQETTLKMFAEEIADVEFMLEEIKYYFKNKGLISYYRNKKERRLDDLLHGIYEEA